jgi:hypothetical protein
MPLCANNDQPDVTPAVRTKLIYLRQFQNRLVIKIRIVRKAQAIAYIQ